MDWCNCKRGRWPFIVVGSVLEYPFNYYGIDFSGLGKLNWWSRCRRFLVKDWQGPNSCKCFQTFGTLNNSTKSFKVAACFGAPLLNLLVGTGIGCTAAILSDPGRADGVLLDVSYITNIDPDFRTRTQNLTERIHRNLNYWCILAWATRNVSILVTSCFGSVIAFYFTSKWFSYGTPVGNFQFHFLLCWTNTLHNFRSILTS